MSTTARLFIDELPQVGEGVKRYMVSCKWGTTEIVYMPGGEIELSEAHLKTVLLERHQSECGKCNMARLWRDHADHDLKRMADEAWEQMHVRALAERRN